MMIQRALVVACIVALSSFNAALAQSTVPSMLGFWDAVEGSHALYNGEIEDKLVGDVEIEVTDQTGYAFKGVIRWSRFDQENSPIHDGTELTPAAQESIVGVFSGDGASFMFVEHPDTAMYFGRILDQSRFELVIVESGEYAVAARLVYERRQ